MNPHIIFHINLYDLASIGTLFAGLVLALLLGFAKRVDRKANLFLGLALGVIVLKTGGITPLLLPVLGPLLYFYVRQLTCPDTQFRRKDLLHFCPLFVAYWMPAWLVLMSVIIYLYLSHRLIQDFYRRLRPVLMDRPRFAFRRLEHALPLIGLLCGLSLFNDVFYLTLAVVLIGMAAVAILKPDSSAQLAMPITDRSDAKDKGRRLRETVATNRLYEDADLTLNSLAVKLMIHPHDLSRIINIGLEKNFSDFINEFRVREVARKMQDPAYDRLTLLGIAYESGFNSKRTFNRVFKEITGKTPVEYKNYLKKEGPIDKLAPLSRIRPVILRSGSQPKWTPEKLNRIYMFKNYLRNAWRHIARHKTYSAINVMGLALGICGCLVIYLVASFEFSFDTFHPDKERIYCVDLSNPENPDPSRSHWNAVPLSMPDAVRNDISGFETVAAYHLYRSKVKIKAGNKVIKTFDQMEGAIVQPGYFDILQYTWLSGSKKTALTQPNTVVLTQSRAQNYFGDLRTDQMIGKTIIYDDSLTVTVTGILKDWNKNSDFNFSDFISYSTIKSSFLKYQIPLDKWDVLEAANQMLVKLPVGVTPSQINAQFPAFFKKHIDANSNPIPHAQLQPFTGIHFHKEYGGPGNKADLRVLYILSAMAVFILFIAAINFINLSTAQSIQRTKDIGILKVLGSGRGGILFQFLTETFILALLAIAIAVIAMRPLLGLFAEYIPPGVKFSFGDYTTWIFLAGIAIFTTLLAGFYPARLLSAFKPVASLKGETGDRAGNKGYLRKSLIVFQFTISLLFIIGTIAINNQINYLQNIDLGVKTSNIITLSNLVRDQTAKMTVLAENLKHLPGIEQVITEGTPPIGRAHMMDPIQLQGTNQDYIGAFTYPGNENFVPFYHMKIVAGRNLFRTDSATEYLINETAAKAMGFRDPKQAIGRLLNFGARKKGWPIVGVVADFYENSFYDKISPCSIAYYPDRQKGIALKLTPAEYQKGDMPTLVSKIAKEWKKLYPEEPFDYAFLSDSVAKLYESEQQTRWLMQTAMVITIFISCMGLFGLAMFTTERRTKEISIRKVLGASVTSILTMLNKEVVVLIAVSLLVSSPIAWYFIHKWLQNFAYHTNLSLWVFMLAGAGAMLIALATISFRTIRSATANPVKGLRNE